MLSELRYDVVDFSRLWFPSKLPVVVYFLNKLFVGLAIVLANEVLVKFLVWFEFTAYAYFWVFLDADRF